MNIRKLISLLELSVILILIYIAYFIPDELVIKTIEIFGILLVIESIFFGYEYFKYVRTGKVILFKTRLTINIDSILNFLVILSLAIILLVNLDKFIDKTYSGLILSLITTLRGSIFNKQKNSIRIDRNRLQFDDLFVKDMYLFEIRNAYMDTEKKNINIFLQDHSMRTLRLNEDYFIGNKEMIENVINDLNNSGLQYRV